MKFIWATRGRDWGFRFLRTEGLTDPLPTYDRGFGGGDSRRALCERGDGVVAVRFPDPHGRRDRAGRVIPHEFVAWGPGTESWQTVADAQAALWPQVAHDYAARWDVDETH